MSVTKKRINDVLSMTDNEKVRVRILNFLERDVQEYSDKINKLEQDVKNGMSSLKEGNRIFSALTNGVIKKAEEVEKIAKGNGLILRNIKETFRNMLIKGPVYKSVMVKRGHDKPRGYPGDYQIIETFYENKPVSKGIGYCVDKHFLKDDYVRAVRDRKDDMKELLYGFIRYSKLSTINILNLGCGSCREIRELFLHNYKTRKKINFTLVDQDEEALRFSEDELNSISDHIPENTRFKFIEENIYNIFSDKKNKNILGKYDLIYSIGLADYLPDAFLGRLIKSCFELLERNGKLIIAHKNIKTYKASAPDWFANWYFFPRNRQDLVEIVDTYLAKTAFKMEFIQGKSRRIFFLVVKKR